MKIDCIHTDRWKRLIDRGDIKRISVLKKINISCISIAVQRHEGSQKTIDAINQYLTETKHEDDKSHVTNYLQFKRKTA